MLKTTKLATALLTSSLLLGCGGSDSDNLADNGYCSAIDANERLYSYMQDWYFWEENLPSTFDPSAYPNIPAAIDALRDVQDRFSFSMTTAQYEDYQASVFFGYGFSHEVNAQEDGLVIRYVYEEGTPAQSGLRRGDTIIEIDGTAMSQIISEVKAGTKSFADYFGPNVSGYSINIKFEKPTGRIESATITKGSITANTVLAKEVKQLEVDNINKNVGYLVFNAFDNVSEQELNDAFDLFKIDSIDELVLDLRYNGGGLIRVANQLSTQIAGDKVDGETFVQYRYNSKQSDSNQTLLFSLGEGIEKMNLDRVVVLTSEGSCSSSELVINSLKPHIEVVTIGNKTCGKPVGMSPTQICDDVIFAINFDSVNSEGEGEYFDGLPVDCRVDEAVTGDWGVESDPLLAEGLNYLQTGACSSGAQNLSDVFGAKTSKASKTIDWTKGPVKAQKLL